MVTKTEIREFSPRKWYFLVFVNNRDFAQVISTLYNTKRETKEALKRYLETGKLDW